MDLSAIESSPHFQEYAELTRLSPTVRQLRGAEPQELVRTLEDPAAPLAVRLGAGALLGLVGDPRIDTTPRTVAVPGAQVSIGLSESKVAEVTAQWAHVGVETDWIAKEVPVHQVVLDAFWLGTYPVANSQYRQFLEETDYQRRPSTWYLGAYPWDRANHPVAGVGACDADAYADWLSQRTGHPWRLPTEAEWEYAAKGPDGREFAWGDTFDACAANTRETGVHTTTPVGAFPLGRSPFGAHDMGGNVEEYVADDYTPYPDGPLVTDHLVQSLGEYRITRGGSFARFGDLTRTRRRHGAFPGVLYPAGLRVATSERPS